jgi:hypothetical protein
VSLKLRKLYKEGHKIDHLFIESSENTVQLIKQFFDCFIFLEDFKLDAVCDKDYENNFKQGKYSGRTPLNTSVNGDYHFPVVDRIKLENEDCFLVREPEVHMLDVDYDVCIQCSAGASSNRNWKFNPITLANLLRNKGYKVSIIGSDEKYCDEKDKDNYVKKLDLKGSMTIIANSDIYVGLSGFHTYWSLASKIKNIHFEESKQHNLHYICNEWNKYRLPVEKGTMIEVIGKLRECGINV